MQRSVVVCILASAMGLGFGCAETKPTQRQVDSFVTAADGGAGPSRDAGDGVDAPRASDAASSTVADAAPTDAAGASAVDTGALAPTEDGAVAATKSDVLRVEGRYLYDTCGNKLMIRGFEQFIARGIDVGGSWDALIDEIAKTGANAVRILPAKDLTAAEIDAVIARIVGHGMVFNITRQEPGWFEDPHLRAVLMKYEPWLMLDAFNEPVYDDRARWLDDVKASILAARAAGYRVPLNVLANHYGRDLPSVLDHGDEIVATDPMHNVILGWQAYWGSATAALAPQYGMTVTEGATAAAAKSFVVQLGLDYYTDPEIDPLQLLDYQAMMETAAAHELGWLWWDFYNPFGRKNNATADGTATNLTAPGAVVVHGSPYGIEHSSARACTPGP